MRKLRLKPMQTLTKKQPLNKRSVRSDKKPYDFGCRAFFLRFEKVKAAHLKNPLRDEPNERRKRAT
jgi:hypothetical protein